MKKTAKRAIGLLLCMMLLFSALYIPMSFTASATTGNYYVQYGGTGDGRSVGSPARSVKTAIASINADGLGAGDTANIYILSSSGVTSSSHTLTPWGISGDPEQTHAATIVIQGYEERQWLAYGESMNSNINLCGPTTFTNLSLFTTRTGDGYIRAYGNNVTFGTGMKYYKLSGSSTQECYAPIVVMTRNTNSSSDYDVTAPQTFTYRSPALTGGKLYIASENYDNRKHKEDVNIIFDHEDIGYSGAFKMAFGGWHSNSSTHTFEKNLNIDVRKAAKIGVQRAKRDDSNSNQKIQVNGGLQIITNPSTKYYNIGVADDISAYAAITGVDSIVNTDIWVLTVAAADRSKLDFTATAGTYSIANHYTATATNTQTGEEVTSENGQLTVGAGDWTVAFVREPVYDYYVQYGGTGDGRTIDAPARSVKTAIASINADGRTASDTANIYVLSSSDAVTSSAHSMTPWGVSGDPEQTHTAQIVVQGYEGRQWLAYGASMNSNLNISGPTTFTNLNLFTTGSTRYLRAYGYNLTFGSGMKFYKLNGSSKQECYAPLLALTRSTNDNSTYDITTKQTFTYNCAGQAEGKLYIGSENFDNRRHREDVTLVFDNANIGSSGAFKMAFGGTNANNSTHTFEKNLNIDVRNAAKIGVQRAKRDDGSSNQKIQVNGGLQIITNPTTKYYNIGVADDISAYAAITGVDSIVNTDIWVLTVPAADRDKIDFTATAGTYKIADGCLAVATNTTTGAVLTSSGSDTLVLPEGDYTLSFTQLFKTHSLVLADKIGINFLLDLSSLTAEEKAASYMTFEVSNSAKELSTEYAETFTSDDKIGFTCYLSSVQMAETVTPTFHYGDGLEVIGAPFSVKDYIDYVVDNSGSFDSTVVDLVKALGDYGHYMQIYLGNKNEWTAGEDYTALGKYRAADYASADYTAYLTELNNNHVAMVKETTGTAVTGVSYNLNFDSTTYINVKLTTSEAITASAVVNGVAVNASGNGLVQLRTRGLPILKLGDAFSVTGSGSSNTTTFTVTLSGLSYIRATLNKESESTAGAKSAVSALYGYYRAACIYQTAVSGGNNGNLNGEMANE